MKGALALLIAGGTENWAPPRWRERFARVCPERPVALIGDDTLDPASVRYAAVWKPKPGALRLFPNLSVIFNLGAGVDAVVADETLPDVPLVRVAVDDLTKRMTEYVVMHVLMHHRRQSYYAESQRALHCFTTPTDAASILNAAANSARVYSLCGRAKISAAAPSSTTLPWRITIRRLASAETTRRSCEMKR